MFLNVCVIYEFFLKRWCMNCWYWYCFRKLSVWCSTSHLKNFNMFLIFAFIDNFSVNVFLIFLIFFCLFICFSQILFFVCLTALRFSLPFVIQILGYGYLLSQDRFLFWRKHQDGNKITYPFTFNFGKKHKKH